MGNTIHPVAGPKPQVAKPVVTHPAVADKPVRAPEQREVEQVDRPEVAINSASGDLSIHEGTGTVVYREVDPQNHVVKQLPTDVQLKLKELAQIRGEELIGNLLDESV